MRKGLGPGWPEKGARGKVSQGGLSITMWCFVNITLERCRQQVVGITVPDHIHLPSREGHFKVKIDACIEFISDELQASANISLALPTGKQVQDPPVSSYP